MSHATQAGSAAPHRAGGTAGLTLAGLCAATGAEAVWCPDPAAPVAGVVAADLMSDVLVDARPAFVQSAPTISYARTNSASLMRAAVGRAPRARRRGRRRACPPPR
ncbi:MAG TPA: hypothetical protein VLN08_18095, partial [Vicinamibacterales bacterium]|nr:hypothetical protein [Vicinamibacterales bacterium]